MASTGGSLSELNPYGLEDTENIQVDDFTPRTTNPYNLDTGEPTPRVHLPGAEISGESSDESEEPTPSHAWSEPVSPRTRARLRQEQKGALYEKQHNFSVITEQQRLKIRETEEQSYRRCTFKPKIKHKPDTAARLAGEDVFQRLQRDAAEQKQRLQEAWKGKGEKDLLDCTFTPRLSVKSATNASINQEGDFMARMVEDLEKRKKRAEDYEHTPTKLGEGQSATDNKGKILSSQEQKEFEERMRKNIQLKEQRQVQLEEKHFGKYTHKKKVESDPIARRRLYSNNKQKNLENLQQREAQAFRQKYNFQPKISDLAKVIPRSTKDLYPEKKLRQEQLERQQQQAKARKPKPNPRTPHRPSMQRSHSAPHRLDDEIYSPQHQSQHQDIDEISQLNALDRHPNSSRTRSSSTASSSSFLYQTSSQSSTPAPQFPQQPQIKTPNYRLSSPHRHSQGHSSASKATPQQTPHHFTPTSSKSQRSTHSHFHATGKPMSTPGSGSRGGGNKRTQHNGAGVVPTPVHAANSAPLTPAAQSKFFHSATTTPLPQFRAGNSPRQHSPRSPRNHESPRPGSPRNYTLHDDLPPPSPIQQTITGYHPPTSSPHHWAEDPSASVVSVTPF